MVQPGRARQVGAGAGDLAKAKPGGLNFGSSGTGSPQFLGGMLLQQLTGTKMNHVPYKGAAPAVADLLPGRIQVWIGAANSLLPHIRDDKLRVLGSTAPAALHRSSATSDIAEPVSRLRAVPVARPVRSRQDAAGDRRPDQRRGR